MVLYESFSRLSFVTLLGLWLSLSLSRETGRLHTRVGVIHTQVLLLASIRGLVVGAMCGLGDVPKLLVWLFFSFLFFFFFFFFFGVYVSTSSSSSGSRGNSLHCVKGTRTRD